MSVRTARRVVFVLLGLYTVLLTYPGVIPFNRIRPLVFGLPFVLVWITLWIVLVGVGLVVLNVVETRAQQTTSAAADPARAPERW